MKILLKDVILIQIHNKFKKKMMILKVIDQKTKIKIINQNNIEKVYLVK